VRVRIWDLPTRAFHIALLLCVAGLLLTGHLGGSWMTWHFRLGYCVLALVLFRLLWGVVGGRWSRFTSFVPSPMTLLRYLQGRHANAERLEIGHNPLGALSVIGLLGLLGLQVACGLVADDEIANVGPLNRFVSTETAALATGWHKDWGQWLLIAAIALHVAAIVYYRVKKRRDLLGPMLHGDKLLDADTPASRDDGRTRGVALLLLAACAAVAVTVARLAT
jgi:cytochrome b